MLNIHIDRQNMVPLYYQLKEELIRLIRCGELRPGDVLPSETEFCQAFDLSRGTVRQAITILSEQGFVLKERGRGTYVKMPTMNHDLLGEYSFGCGIRKLGLEVHSKVLAAKVIHPRTSIAKRLNLEKNESVFHLLRVRYADQEPWIYEDSYLPCRLFPGIEKHDFTSNLLSDIVAEKYGVQMSSISAFVEPIVLNEQFAKYLEVDCGLPALVMDRVISDNMGTPIQYSHAVVRGDRCRYYFKVQG